ncbi:hypothetical protein VNO80_11587 [Phaseolus coccineus]|uniref:Uncharacterized protein n=1 Tax=Phaseolus coccineus TaxID=3886 RepID=A0AAN9NFG3_PHACN
MLAGSRLFTKEVHSGWNYKASDQASFPSKVRLRGMLSGSRSWRRRVLRSTLSVKVSNGNLPSNTKMILGPGFIPPTQLLLFSFSQSSYFACPHGKAFSFFLLSSFSQIVTINNALLQLVFAGSEFSTH